MCFSPAARADAPAASDAFTPAQRAEIVRIVRDALRTDPSILGDAITALRASEQKRDQDESAAAVNDNRAAIDGQPGDAVLGNPRGDVTVTEFYDPRCPYCRKVLPDLDKLLAADHGVRLVEKLIPILGPNSVLDAQAIQAASLQNRYAAMQAALMGDSGAPGLDRIRAAATRLGLDVPRLVADMKSPAVTAVLERNVALARTIHLSGTPTFVIGNTVIPGAVDADEIRRAVAARRGAGRNAG
ncbi:MAG: DsbA family protein [Gluconacetobacter diazotrophicus]|nr:DsbA family protein [Gluconacetobacter diazotrophicus]